MERKGRVRDVLSDTGMSQTCAEGRTGTNGDHKCTSPTLPTKFPGYSCTFNDWGMCFIRQYLKNVKLELDFSCENIFSNLSLI